MIGSFASGATASLVAKNGTNQLSQLFEDGFWCSRCLNDCIKVPNMIGSFTSDATASLGAKKELKNYYTTVDKIITTGQILVFDVSKWLSWHEYYHGAKVNRFGLAGLSTAAILDFQMSISRPFEELQGWNSEFKPITPKSITKTYIDTKLSMFGLVSLLMAAFLDFQKSISQPFEELQGWNLEFKLITPKYNTRTNFYTTLSRFGLASLAMAAIFKCPYLSHLKSYRAEI